MNFTVTILLLVLPYTCISQEKKEQDFNIAVKEVIQAFSKQDSRLLSRYIHKETGILLLHRIGVFDTYTRYTKINFSDSSYPSALFRTPNKIKSYPLQYDHLPKIDCEKGWNKNGLFVDTTKTDHLLSKICKERNKWHLDTIPAKKIKYFISLENRSRRVVLVNHHTWDLIFYMTYIDGKWYITIFDTATSDCSV